MPVVKPRVIRRRVERQKPEKIKRTLNIRDFYRKRNKILIIRSVGGLGDILMHRMMFEDFQMLMPDAEIYFACPCQFHDAMIDHPYVKEVLDSEKVERHEYIVSYNTTTACGRYEMRVAPFSGEHRSDIWATHCGVALTRHDMHIQLSEKEIARGKEMIEAQRDREGPSVLIAPISAMENKNLLDHQLGPLVDGLQERGCYAFGLHKTPISVLVKKDVPHIYGVDLRTWMAVIASADYVISVDTAAFHLAGGLSKPLVGIFTFVNAETYARYYPNTELVQGHCPVGYSGCYNWGNCPVKEKDLLPCRTNLNSKSILQSFDKIVDRFPM